MAGIGAVRVAGIGATEPAFTERRLQTAGRGGERVLWVIFNGAVSAFQCVIKLMVYHLTRAALGGG